MLRMRHGGSAGSRGYYRIYGQQSLRTGRAAPQPGFGDARWSMSQMGFRGDWTPGDSTRLTIQADAYRSGARLFNNLPILTSPFEELTVDHPEAWGGNILMRLEHQHRTGGVSVLQSYYDQAKRSGDALNLEVMTSDVEYQYRHPVRWKQEFSFSMGQRSISDRAPPSPLFRETVEKKNYGLQHVTLQDDITLVPDQFAASLAVRFERNSFTNWTTQPTARVLWTPTKSHTIWGAASRSVRTPTRGELSAELIAGIEAAPGGLPLVKLVSSNPALQNEVGKSLEAGHRWQVHKKLSLDSTAFYNHYNNLMDLAVGDVSMRSTGQTMYLLLPLEYRNLKGTHTRGFEAYVQYTANRNLQLSGSFTGLDYLQVYGLPSPAAYDPLTLIASSPSKQFQLRAEWKPARNWELDISYFWYGALLPKSYAALGRQRGEVRLGWRFTEHIDLSIGAHGLTGGNRVEFVKEAPGALLNPISPSAYFRLGFRF